MPEKKPTNKNRSALKRTRQAERRRLRNKSVKTYLKTLTKRIEGAVDDNDIEGAKAALKVAIPAIYKASSKKVIHKNSASRKVSRLTKKVNMLTKVPVTS